MPLFKVVIYMQEDSIEDAEDHLLSLSDSDLLEHLQEQESITPFDLTLKEHLLNGGKTFTVTDEDGTYLYLKTIDGWENCIGKMKKEEEVWV